MTPDEHADADWSVSLGTSPSPWVTEPPMKDDGSPPPTGPSRLGRRHLGAAAALVVVLAAALVIWRPEAPPRRGLTSSSLLGSRLAVPVSLRLPPGAVTTADEGYVGFQVPGEGAVIVTVPTQVVNPGGTQESRLPLPADPAAWLESHPDVFVSRVSIVQVGGRPATQLDYRRSNAAEPRSQFAGLSLFCGPKTPPACTRITSSARVRATFVPVAGRTVLVEAVWRTDQNDPGWPMPTGLREAYTKVLAGLTEGARSPGRPSPSS